GNTAYSIGGGVSNVNASPILTNVIISGNSANYGGGISNMDMGMSDPQILTNVTISGNTANNDGGGIYNMSMGMGSSLTLYNSIVLGNNSGIAGDPIDGSSSKNLIQTGDENSEGAFDGITIPGATASAIFVDPQAPAQTTDGDYSLLCFPDNPAINSGDDTYNTESLDLAGNNRKVGIIDLGAYELQGISNDASLTECEDIIGSSSGTFDLINAEADISTTTGLTFTYYSDATYTTAINDPTSFTANNGDIVYVTVNDGACFDYAEITLNTKSQSAGTDIITACDSYTWIDGNEYTTSNNTATYTLTNAAGCDSIVTLDLTIIVIDKTINELNDELSATQNGATYQWIDCDDNDAPIVGATSQSFEPTQDGNYAVIITLGSCSEQSDCYPFSTLGVNTEFTDKWNVYPNPVNDQLFIESTQDIVIYIYDITGKIMNVSTLKSGLESIDVSNFAKGVYVIKSDKGAVSKFVKK
ncbi:MAG: T9SS type A sorting domain-containing protein, partial [Brumimicrobium sp.]|nr:T9SS type A sorting domain-containing protein [Brumimicrobium sp.]